jgi:hypothetical protein
MSGTASQKKGGPAAQAKADILSRIESGALLAATPHPRLAGRIALGDVTSAHAKAAGGEPADPASKQFAEHHLTHSLLDQALSAPNALPNLPKGVKVDSLKQAVAAALDVFRVAAPAASKPAPKKVDLASMAQTMRKALDPAGTIEERVLARLHVEHQEAARKGPEREDALAPLLASPDFPQPMYEGLREISQDLILPGIETVPQETVAVLKTNRRFVEAYLAGLNHAFTAELLWRGAPVGGRSTFFRQFWDVADAAATGQLQDIKPITAWGDTRLGDNATDGAKPDGLVLLIRGKMVRKFPNTRVYAVKAMKSGGRRVPGLAEFTPDPQPPLLPAFHGSLAPDVLFCGFAFTETDARGGTSNFPDGVFFVLEERISEARFGFDDGRGGATDVSSEHSAAAVAAMLLREPVRIAVHAERLLPAKAPQPAPPRREGGR